MSDRVRDDILRIMGNDPTKIWTMQEIGILMSLYWEDKIIRYTLDRLCVQQKIEKRANGYTLIRP